MRTTLLLLSPLTTLVSANNHHSGVVRRHFAFEGTKTADVNANVGGQVEGQAGLTGAGSVAATKSFGLEGSAGPASIHGGASKSMHIGGQGVGQAGMSESVNGDASIGGEAAVHGEAGKVINVNGQVGGQAGISGSIEGSGSTQGEGSFHTETGKTITGAGTGAGAGEAGMSTTVTSGVSSSTEGGSSSNGDGHGYVGPVVTWSPDAQGADFDSPCKNGGNMSFSTTSTSGTFIKPEPLNIIISAASQFPSVAGQDNEKAFYTQLGFAQYLSGLDISNECLGFHFAQDTTAQVNGPTPELVNFVYRENFKNGAHGTCDAALNGGLKLHGWRQTVTGAYFVGAQMSGGEKAFQVPQADGYNLGRDNFAARAAVGGKDYLGCVWPPAKVEHLTGLCAAEQASGASIYNHDIDIDGMVLVVTVPKPVCPPGIVTPGGNGNNTNNNGTWSSGAPPTSGLTPVTPAPSPPTNKPPTTPPKHMPKANVASSRAVALGSVLAGLLVAIMAI